MIKGSDLFVAALENEGVERIFGVPGEENLDTVDSLRTSRIELVVTRHEQSAAFMAATLKLVDENPCVFGVVDRYGHHVHPAPLERRLQDGNEVLTGLHARSLCAVGLRVGHEIRIAEGHVNTGSLHPRRWPIRHMARRARRDRPRPARMPA